MKPEKRFNEDNFIFSRAAVAAREKINKNQIIFFPVRHHSPTSARLVQQMIADLRPAAVLIEGPSDFNDRLDELALPHRLPIAIYSYLQLPDGRRRGAFYPFCEHSPEWQALQCARAANATVRFIDLPWAALADESPSTHLYADGALGSGEYIDHLCRELGVENFHDLWDHLFEIDPDLSLNDYLERILTLCTHMRMMDGNVSPIDLRREAFMVEQIRQTRAEISGPLLIVTGAYHTPALFAALENPAAEQIASDLLPTADSTPSPSTISRGLALTPYSYLQLDTLTGYNAGLTHPAFYHQLWLDRRQGTGKETYRTLLAQSVAYLRRHKQIASSADLIAVETLSQGLATFRGHAIVWRTDLVDGIIGALIKDELAYGQSHPFLNAIYAVFRGTERGKLAAGAQLPPLVHDIAALLKHHDLELLPQKRTLSLDLFKAEDLARSRVLHCLAGLEISGFVRTGGSDLLLRDDLTNIWENWEITWTPTFDANCIEAAIYGATLQEAAGAHLLELAGAAQRSASAAARYLLDAALMGLAHLTVEFYSRLTLLIRQDSDFCNITAAMGHLLYLYRYDEVLGAAGKEEIGALLVEVFTRCLWLLDNLGQPQGKDKELLYGIATLVETLERCETTLSLNRADLEESFLRVSTDPTGLPLVRGATMGALWTLGKTAVEDLHYSLNYFSAPAHLGDYLTGLFHLARETVQRQPELLHTLNTLLLSYTGEEFLEALPPLRLAFSYFTPREKDYLARTLLGTVPALTVLAPLSVPAEVAAAIQAWEEQLFQTAERYNLIVPPKGL